MNDDIRLLNTSGFEISEKIKPLKNCKVNRKWDGSYIIVNYNNNRYKIILRIETEYKNCVKSVNNLTDIEYIISKTINEQIEDNFDQIYLYDEIDNIFCLTYNGDPRFMYYNIESM